MPLTVPVDEAIIEKVIESLEEIDDITVIRQTKSIEEWTPEDLQIVVVKGGPTRVTDLDCPGNPPALAWQLEVKLRLHVIPSEHDDTATEEYSSVFVAEVLKEITSTAGWYHWSGLAIDSQIGDIEPISSDGGFDCTVLPLLITYRVSENNPYEVRA